MSEIVYLPDGSQALQVQIAKSTNKTIQTHNAVSIALSSWNAQANWIDTDGFDKIAFTFVNDAATSSSANVLWSNDGVTQHGETVSVIPNNTTQRKDGIVDTRARYAKLAISNADGALAHTVSAWAYLKA